jgi:mannose-6-phosphate isomerase-like protein (cupin superfamily)
MKPVEKPWGTYTVLGKIDSPHGSVVFKHIIIRAGENISVQYHNFRCEHWHMITSGRITIGSTERQVYPNDIILIKPGMVHCIWADQDDVELLEIQFGICEESDIVRIQDKYGRSD